MFLLGARAGLWRLRALGIEILFLGGTTLRKREKRGVGLTTRVGWRSVECLSWVKAGCRRQVNGTAGLPSAPEMAYVSRYTYARCQGSG
jgi:hypothetical protein